MIMLILEQLPSKLYELVLVNWYRGKQGSVNKFSLLQFLIANKMGNLYGGALAAVKQIYKDDVTIDNLIFKLHRSFTVLICLLFCTIFLAADVSFQYIYEYFYADSFIVSWSELFIYEFLVYTNSKYYFQIIVTKLRKILVVFKYP